MNDYKVKKLENVGKSTRAQIIRTSDNKEMLDSPVQMSVAKKWAKEMNEKTKMGLYLINI